MEQAPPSLAPSSQPEIHAAAERPPPAQNLVAVPAPSCPPARNIYLPDTGIRLAKLPPITDKVDLMPNYPVTPLLREKPRLFPKGSVPPGTVRKSKEPKFVPYEPYKGAVKPFFDVTPKGGVVPRQWTPERKLSQQQGASAAASAEKEERSVPEEVERLEQNYRAMLEAKEKEIERLQQSLKSAEKQLRIQTQVFLSEKDLCQSCGRGGEGFERTSFVGSES